MISSILSIVALAIPAPLGESRGGPAPAPSARSPASQGKEDLRKEFVAREAALQETDVEGHHALALWAARSGLSAESQRLLRKIINKLDPDHAAARKELGFVRHEDKWILETELKARLAKEEEERFKRDGYVKVRGEWVHKDDVEMARKGLVRHEGQWIPIEDKKKIDAGSIRHPETGEWIAKEDLEKAQAGLFPVGTRWVDKETADKVHNTWDAPWTILTENFTLKGPFPFDRMSEARSEAETVMLGAKGVFGMRTPDRVPAMQILLFLNRDEYARFTTTTARSDTGLSLYGAYYCEHHPDRPVAVFYGEKDWGPYYLKHGVGLLVAHRFLEQANAKLTSVHWFPTGVGSYLSRWANKGHAQHFGKQYVAKGGVRDLKRFFKSFDINQDMPTEEVEWTIYQAGLVVSFAVNGGEREVTDAFVAVNNALASGKGIEAAFQRLEARIVASEKALKSYLEKLLEG